MNPWWGGKIFSSLPATRFPPEPKYRSASRSGISGVMDSKKSGRDTPAAAVRPFSADREIQKARLPGSVS